MLPVELATVVPAGSVVRAAPSLSMRHLQHVQQRMSSVGQSAAGIMVAGQNSGMNAMVQQAVTVQANPERRSAVSCCESWAIRPGLSPLRKGEERESNYAFPLFDF